MRIDEGCINHNAVRMIKDLVESPHAGIIEMADAMKEVLKA